MKQFLKSVVIVSSLALLAAPFTASAGEGQATGKKMSCKDEAKTLKFKDKTERTKFMKDCKAKSKAAK